MRMQNRIATGLFLIATTFMSSAWAAQDLEVDGNVSAEVQATRMVNIPAADFFLPMVLNIRAGDSVRFVNNDGDAHTVTTDPVYSSSYFQGVNVTLHGRNNSGPGSVRIRFNRPGTFTYYCRNHAHLDQGQPVNGGVEGNGVPGRPMMGIVIVR
jgi:plastocyanin